MRNLILSSLILMGGLSAFAGNVTVTTEMKTPFQAVHEQIARAIYSEVPSLFSRSCEEGKDNGYRCGEIPAGTIDSDGDKVLIHVTIPAKKFSQKGFKGTFPATQFEVTMSRKQLGGAPIPEKLIGDATPLTTSNYLGKDIFVKLDSKNNKMGGVACVYVPGVKTKVSEVKNSFTAKKKVWFLTSKTKITTTINIGESSFDSIKTCIAFQVTPVTDPKTKALSYTYSMVAQSKPVFLNLKRGPIKVKVDVKGANFLGSIVNVFAKSTITKQVKATIQKQVAKEVDDIYESDVLDGKWFPKFINSKTLKLVKTLSGQLEKALNKPYTPDTAQFIDSYQNACEKVKKTSLNEFKKVVAGGQASAAQLEKLTTKFDDFCGDFESLSVSAFNKTSQSTGAGCYSGNVRVTDMDPILRPRLNKDAFQCQFVHKVSIQVDSNFKGLGQCMMDQWKYKFTDTCNDEIVGILKYGTQL